MNGVLRRKDGSNEKALVFIASPNNRVGSGTPTDVRAKSLEKEERKWLG